MKMEQTECSEMLAHKIQTPGNHPKESIQRNKTPLVKLLSKCYNVWFMHIYLGNVISMQRLPIKHINWKEIFNANRVHNDEIIKMSL